MFLIQILKSYAKLKMEQAGIPKTIVVGFLPVFCCKL